MQETETILLLPALQAIVHHRQMFPNQASSIISLTSSVEAIFQKTFIRHHIMYHLLETATTWRPTLVVVDLISQDLDHMVIFLIWFHNNNIIIVITSLTQQPRLPLTSWAWQPQRKVNPMPTILVIGTIIRRTIFLILGQQPPWPHLTLLLIRNITIHILCQIKWWPPMLISMKNLLN